MKSKRVFFIGALACVIFAAAGLLADDAAPTNNAATTPPVYVPDTSHENDPLPDGVLAWNSVSQSTNAAADQDAAEFVFEFTNTTVNPVTILNVRPACHCTTAELPPTPWTIPAGSNGMFKASVDLNVTGHTGTLFKQVTVTTDKGMKNLLMLIDFLPPVVTKMTDEQKAAGIAAAKVDRQAIFKADCATCHVKPGEGKYGPALYAAVCAICHEANPRATMIPDLHDLKVPTNEQFWQTWIAYGKPGSIMPAFSTAEGGPLTDMQIASLTAYLNSAIPSHVPPPPQ